MTSLRPVHEPGHPLLIGCYSDVWHTQSRQLADHEETFAELKSVLNTLSPESLTLSLTY